MKSNPQSSPAEEQASLWASRLEGSTLTADLRTALDAWLAADPGHRTLLSQYCQFSADLEQTLPALAAADALPMPAAQPLHRRNFWRTFHVFAGSALATAAAAAIVWLVWPTARVERIATPAGQRQSITLADGTHVELNARTSLQIEIGRTERRVRLADGEAFFTVSKEPSRPFIVETPAGSVRVTGTVFNVRSEAASQLEVTVVEGSVLVRPGQDGGAPIPLGARDRFAADATGSKLQQLSASDLDNALAWREGKIFFEGATVRAALDRFARYHGIGIYVATAVDATGHTVGGLYSIDDLDTFLASIELAYSDLSVNREPNGPVRVSVRSKP
jgi:transmembrane sensor